MNRWTWLYLQLLVMMAVMMAVSFLPEYFHEFFGDWRCGGFEDRWTDQGYQILNNSCLYFQQDHNPTWHWGWRHRMLIIFAVVFCIVNICRLISGWERRES